MRIALCALALFALGGTLAEARARSCRDLLLSSPAKRYSCTAAYRYTEVGPPYLEGTASFEGEFVELDPPDPTVFAMRAANGTEKRCICDSRGSAAKPAFNASRSFTCLSSGYVTHGEVTGRDGDRIRNFTIDEIRPQSEGGAELNVGGCVRIR